MSKVNYQNQVSPNCLCRAVVLLLKLHVRKW